MILGPCPTLQGRPVAARRGSIGSGSLPAYNRPVSLSQNQKKHLRGLGHALEPVVLIGQQGLTDAVVREMASALAVHELLKVRVRVGDRATRSQILSTLAERTSSELVQTIGNVGLFYKKNNKLPNVLLPDS